MNEKYIFTQEDMTTWHNCFAKQQNMLPIYNQASSSNQEFLESYYNNYLQDSFKNYEYTNGFVNKEYLAFFQYLASTDFPFVEENINYLAGSKNYSELFYVQKLLLFSSAIKDNNIQIFQEQLLSIYPNLHKKEVENASIAAINCVHLLSQVENNKSQKTFAIESFNTLLEHSGKLHYDAQQSIYSYFSDVLKTENLQPYSHFFPSLYSDNWLKEEDWFESVLVIDYDKLIHQYGFDFSDYTALKTLLYKLQSNFMQYEFINKNFTHVSFNNLNVLVTSDSVYNFAFSSNNKEDCYTLKNAFKEILLYSLNNFHSLAKDLDHITPDYLDNTLSNIRLNQKLQHLTVNNKKENFKRKL